MYGCHCQVDRHNYLMGFVPCVGLGVTHHSFFVNMSDNDSDGATPLPDGCIHPFHCPNRCCQRVFTTQHGLSMHFYTSRMPFKHHTQMHVVQLWTKERCQGWQTAKQHEQMHVECNYGPGNVVRVGKQLNTTNRCMYNPMILKPMVPTVTITLDPWSTTLDFLLHLAKYLFPRSQGMENSQSLEPSTNPSYFNQDVKSKR